jgi:hypothetical protein
MKIPKFEHRHQKVAPVSVFARRLAAHILIALLLIMMALFFGVAGYHWIAGLSWVDALLNASMILGGMGPVDTMASANAKIFASLYALFSGLVFIAIMGIVLSPIAHRMLHKFHVDEKDL